MGDEEDRGKGVLGTRNVLKESWRVYRENFVLLSLVGLIVLPAGILFIYLLNGSPVSLIPVDAVTTAWQAGAVVLVIQAAYSRRTGPRSAPHFLGAVWPRLFWVVLLFGLTEVLIGLGTVLLIVPGVILYLLWFVALPSMMVEGLGVFDSMGRSADLTRGLRKKILWIVLIILASDILLAGLGFLARDIDPAIRAVWNLGTGVVINPLVMAIHTVVYFRLVSLKGPRLVPAGPFVAPPEGPGAASPASGAQVNQLEVDPPATDPGNAH